MITGGCQCGAVRYEADGPIQEFSHCHCSICRRLHGAAFVSWAGVARAGFRYLSGEQEVTLYPSSESIDRWFCRHCGSQLLAHMNTEPGVYYLSMGTVDGEPQLPPGYHFFIGSKAPWITVADGLPQYEEWPPDSPNI